MVDQDHRLKLRHLAISKLWAELHEANKTNDKDLAELLEYQAMVLMLACQKVLEVMEARNHNP